MAMTHDWRFQAWCVAGVVAFLLIAAVMGGHGK